MATLAGAALLLIVAVPQGEGEAKPQFGPISVSIDESGVLSVGFDRSVVTPIGTFAISATIPLDLAAKSSLLEFRHQQRGAGVKSLFDLRDFAAGDANLVATGSSGVQVSGAREHQVVMIPAKAQRFLLDVDDHAKVETPSAPRTWRVRISTSQPTPSGTVTPTMTTPPSTHGPTTVHPTFSTSRPTDTRSSTPTTTPLETEGP